MTPRQSELWRHGLKLLEARISLHSQLALFGRDRANRAGLVSAILDVDSRLRDTLYEVLADK